MLKAFPDEFRSTIERAKHIPSLAYRIAMVADGRLEGTFVKRNSHDWDLAAADLILERAGGRLTDLYEAPLVYNRPQVSHGELCGAAQSRLAEFIGAIAKIRSS